ncbi:hypothetical protein QOU29_16540 [Pseudomonas aeruginosa]
MATLFMMPRDADPLDTVPMEQARGSSSSPHAVGIGDHAGHRPPLLVFPPHLREDNRKSPFVRDTQMQACQVFSELDEVAIRLEQLYLAREALREAVNQAHLQRVRLTPNHPSVFAGLEMWGWLVGALREQLRALGWFAHEKSNYPLTIHSTLNLAIAVASGDSNVGNPLGLPSNRSKKGKNTVDAVEQNRQFDMFAELLPEPEQLPESGSHDTWILLHHTDPAKKEIRMELSRPSGIGKGGKISSWSERIMLGSIDLDDDFTEITHPSGPDIDIEIRRKNT